MFAFVLCLSLAIAVSVALPVDFDFYPSALQSNYLYDFDGYDAIPYRVPTSPYYVYDVSEGRWIPKPNVLPSFQQPVRDGVPPNVPQIPLNTNHRRRANRRQSVLRPGHSATFDAFRGAIAFG